MLVDENCNRVNDACKVGGTDFAAGVGRLLGPGVLQLVEDVPLMLG